LTDAATPVVPVLTPAPYWFLRHGETDWNRANRTQGSTEVPLNETGIAQAHAAAALLRGRGIERIFSSPLGRARHTAEIAAAALGVPMEVHDDLREASFGLHEGEVMGAWFAAWAAGEVAPEGGESFQQVKARVVGAVNRVLAVPGLSLIVAHGGMFRTLRAAMGFSANVRTANGVPTLCTPQAGAWTMTLAETPATGPA
jgi:probable phosphoglycerate mutase